MAQQEFSEPAKIYKIATTELFEKAQKSGGLFPGQPLDLADKYFHFSTSTQIPLVLSRFYKGIASQNTLVEIDVAAYKKWLAENDRGELRWEAPSHALSEEEEEKQKQKENSNDVKFPHGYILSKEQAFGLPTTSNIITRTGVIQEPEKGKFVHFLQEQEQEGEQAAEKWKQEQGNEEGEEAATKIYKIATSEILDKCLKEGTNFPGQPVDIEDGFFHFSTPAQLPFVLKKFYTGCAAENTLLEIDVAEYKKWLAANSGNFRYDHSNAKFAGYHGSTKFPHAYPAAIGMPISEPVVTKIGKIQEPEPGNIVTFLS